jgi:hypothetical protein
MKRVVGLVGRNSRALVAGTLGAALLLAASQAQALELGILPLFLKGGNGGLAYGGSLVAKQDIWRYAEISGRVGYSKSDCHMVKSVPLEFTAEMKYPLFNDRLVPYAGMGIGYHIWTGGLVDLENSIAWYPLGGINWYFDKKKKWALFIEGRYEFMDANIISGGPPGMTQASFTRWGGGFGISYRF